MDLNDALMLWPVLGTDYTMESEHIGKAFVCWFIKDREVKGSTRAVPGGFYWDYPQELVDKATELKSEGVSIYDHYQSLQI